MATAYAIECKPTETLIDGECIPTSCVFPSFETGEPSVCSDHGECQSEGIRHICGCEFGFSLDFKKGCVPSHCPVVEGEYCKFGKCQKNGLGVYVCVCDEGYTLFKESCYSEVCLSQPSNHSSVCNGEDAGTCVHDVDTDTWECECSRLFSGDHCEACSDDAFAFNNTCFDNVCKVIRPDGVVTVCNGLGTCYSPYDSDEYFCMCGQGTSINLTDECYFNGCFDWPEGEVMCSNHGFCTDVRCICDDGYAGVRCEIEGAPVCADDETLIDYTHCVKTACVSPSFENVNILAECAGHGVCSDSLNTCVCDDDFVNYKDTCVPRACFNATSETVCSHGLCDYDVSTDTYMCFCEDGYSMVEGACVTNNCVFNDLDAPYAPSICSGHGDCKYNETIKDLSCVCEEGFSIVIGFGCAPNRCQTNGEVCAHGKCELHEGEGYYCTCDPHFIFYHGECVHENCLEPDAIYNYRCCTTPSNGYCAEKDGVWGCQCLGAAAGKYCGECEEGAVMLSDYCVSSHCIDTYSNSEYFAPSICGNAGVCTKDPTIGWHCVCLDGMYARGPTCGQPACLRDPADVQFCSAHGHCYAEKCVCEPTYRGTYCEIAPEDCAFNEALVDYKCYPKTCVFNGTVCGGHGTCNVAADFTGHCVCEADFVLTSTGCNHKSCLTSEDSTEACEGHGACVASGSSFVCQCTGSYAGSYCERCSTSAQLIGDKCVLKSCVYKDAQNTEYVCSGIGECSENELSGSSCICPEGSKASGNLCIAKACGRSCSGHGKCLYDKCVCDPWYHGETCSENTSVICDPGFSVVNELCVPAVCMTGKTVCNGHGTCAMTSADSWQCRCQNSWDGPDCSVSTLCEAGSQYIHSALRCVPNACVFQDIKNNGELSICGGAVEEEYAKCVQNAEDKTWKCVCGSPFNPDSTFGCMPGACDPTGTSKPCDGGICMNFEGGYHCKCAPGFAQIGRECISEKCAIHSPLTGDTVCGSVGKCVFENGDYHCVCPDLTGGPMCEDCILGATSTGSGCVSDNCIEARPNVITKSCGGYGYCRKSSDTGVWKCDCDSSSYPAGNICVPKTCMHSSTDNKECSGHGVCNEKACKCDQGYRGDTCEIAPPTCEENYVLVGYECAPVECVFENTVCGAGGHGSCVETSSKGHFACSCESLFVLTTSGCQHLNCTIMVSGLPTSCSGQGACVATEDKNHPYQCSCNELAKGTFCESCTSVSVRVGDKCVSKTCAYSRPSGEPLVCSDAGYCAEVPGSDLPACVCDDPLYFSGIGQCVSVGCLSEGFNNGSCTNHGYCYFGECHCNPYYHGFTCEKKTDVPCEDGFIYIEKQCVAAKCMLNDQICSNHGHCDEIALDAWKCFCDDGWTGSQCQKKKAQ